jgi:hypothetical protein
MFWYSVIALERVVVLLKEGVEWEFDVYKFYQFHRMEPSSLNQQSLRQKIPTFYKIKTCLSAPVHKVSYRRNLASDFDAFGFSDNNSCHSSPLFTEVSPFGLCTILWRRQFSGISEIKNKFLICLTWSQDELLSCSHAHY